MESENQLLECEAAERECKEKCRYVTYRMLYTVYSLLEYDKLNETNYDMNYI